MAVDYAQARREYRFECPQRFNFTRDVLGRHAAERPDARALSRVDGAGHSERRTFREMSEATARVANLLSAAGVRRGERIVIVLGRQVAWWETMCAGLRMGAVVSPGTTQLSPRDIAYRVNACGAR